MQHTETSPEHRADDSDHQNSDQQNGPVWTPPPLTRPAPHVVAGKVIRTIFDWETGAWQHEHEGPIFDWGFLPPRPLRSSCSLPPPPIPRPFTDPIAGKATPHFGMIVSAVEQQDLARQEEAARQQAEILRQSDAAARQHEAARQQEFIRQQELARQ